MTVNITFNYFAYIVNMLLNINFILNLLELTRIHFRRYNYS